VIVECPACHTRYRINDSAALSESSLFECTRCHKVFPCPPELLKSEELAPPPVDLAPPLDNPPGDELPATGPSPLEPTTPGAPRTAQTPPSSPRSSPPVTLSARTPLGSFDEIDEFSLADEEELTYPPAEVHQPQETETEAEHAVSFRPRTRPPTEATLSHKLLFGFLGMLVLGYALLGVYGRTHIEKTEGLLAQLPLIGPRFIASQFSEQNISLSDLKSSVWVTKDSKRVLAISGKATNTAPVPAATIQVEGTLYDATGKVLGQQQTFCGTETAAEMLPNLTIREIGILQNLAPPKQFSVASGQSINFLLVFVTPPATVSELSCRIVTAQFRTP
jgi:predicted Zn finger-like uncharacterized protein